MSGVFFIAVLFLAAKGCTALGLGRAMTAPRTNALVSIGIGWLLINTAIQIVLLAASIGSCLSGALLWLTVGAGLILAVSRRRPASEGRKCENGFLMTLLLFCLCAVGMALAYRSLYYFDTTWDALTYELPRIDLWAKTGSLYFNQDTAQINIFANEWNGELVALQYVLITGQEQAANFGNVEVWGLTVAATAAVLASFPLRRVFIAAVVLVVESSPFALGMSFTLKGDLLAVGACLFAIATATGADLPWAQRMIFGVGFLSLGLGAKIVMAPVWLAGTAYLVGQSLRKRHCSGSILGATACLALPNLVRYFANFVQYGKLTPRPAAEEPSWDPANVGRSLHHIGSRLLAPDELLGKPGRWVLSMGGGFVFPLVLIVAVTVAIYMRSARARPGLARPLSAIAPWCLVLAFAAAFLLLTIPWADWGLRYHAVWIFPLLIVSLGYLGCALSEGLVVGFGLLSLVLASVQVAYAFSPGECLPEPLSQAMSASPLERKLALHPYLATETVRKISNARSGSLVIFDALNSAVSPFVDTVPSKPVYLCATTAELADVLHLRRPDYVVQSGPLESRSTSAARLLRARGYAEIESTRFWTCWAVDTRPAP